MADDHTPDTTSGTSSGNGTDRPGQLAPPPAPGWIAIDRALAKVYPDTPPHGHWGVAQSWRDGGPDPLDGISAWKVDRDGSPPHWHLVTYGFTELFEKESEIAEMSGFGHELTWRLVREEADGDQPPMWALSFLHHLGRYVFQTGRTFREFHYMNLNSPIVQHIETGIRAICLMRDPDLPDEFESPFGKAGFLQIVGIHLDELAAMQDWNTEGVLELARKKDPLLVTSLSRPSWLADDAAFRTAVEEGAARDGSSQGAALVEGLLLMRAGATEEKPAKDEPAMLELHLDLPAAQQFVRMLERRIGYGRRFVMVSQGAGVEVLPAEEGETTGLGLDTAEGVLQIRLTADAATAMREVMKAEPGRYEWRELLPGFVILVHEVLPQFQVDEAGGAGEPGTDGPGV
ncbi:MAG: suppressor of fused domain protein [Planctomycetota bacterium]